MMIERTNEGKLPNHPNLFKSNQQLQSNLTINYVTENLNQDEIDETPIFTGNSTANIAFESTYNDVALPIYFGEYRTIQIPKGIRGRIKKLPKTILNNIDYKKEIAVEKCLVMASNLTYTVFQDKDYWKGLSSKILHKQFNKGSDNTFVYNKIIKALKYETDSTDPIIECKLNENNQETYQEGNYSKQYRLTESSRNKNLELYEIKHPEILSKRKTHYFEQVKLASKSKIGKNLIEVYGKITLPSEKKILQHAKNLIQKNHKNKKGKKLTFLNKKPRSYYSNPDQRTFVEENIKLFNYLVGVNFIIPKTGDFKSGGRVVDSFNLMPSWIRELVKIDNEELCELDFKTLHPNIALYLYGKPKTQITHEYVAEALEKPLREVKIEHLSFFNRRVEDMKKSILYEFYYKTQIEMLENLILEKLESGYKRTSQKLFKKEVSIMSDIIEQLNKLDIYVLYVYDALYCKKSDQKIVTEIMNRIIKNHGVLTTIG
jgi:hypothetical protein